MDGQFADDAVLLVTTRAGAEMVRPLVTFISSLEGQAVLKDNKLNTKRHVQYQSGLHVR